MELFLMIFGGFLIATVCCFALLALYAVWVAVVEDIKDGKEHEE